MTAALAGFWVLAVISLASALGVVLHRNPVRSALLLILNFFCLAIAYLMLNAQVLAVLQVLVYAGAIMVLFLFVIMLLNLGGESTRTDPLAGQKWIGAILGIALLVGLGAAVATAAGQTPVTSAQMARTAQAQQQGVSQIQIIGWDLFTRYVYPFELTSVLLLVGAMGVVLLTRRRPVVEIKDGTRP